MSEGLLFYSLTKLSWNPFFKPIVPKTRLVYLTCLLDPLEPLLCRFLPLFNKKSETNEIYQ